MSSSDFSDEDSNHFEYWNNWEPPEDQTIVKKRHSNEDNCSTFSALRYDKKIMTQSGVQRLKKFGNWIPPLNFSNACGDVLSKKKPIQKAQVEVAKGKQKTERYSEKLDMSAADLSKGSADSRTTWKKNLNLDWGNRVSLHDVTSFKDGDLFWGIVDLGCFGLMKLWVNDYGNICGLAEGTISKIGCSETSLISITNIQLLRKMLNITNTQWASLSETVQETKTTLKFEAMNECELSGKSSLERLWWFVCKRRHFLPDLCMLVKLNGAVKCFREFKIIPKLTVQDIRNIQGY